MQGQNDDGRVEVEVELEDEERGRGLAPMANRTNSGPFCSWSFLKTRPRLLNLVLSYYQAWTVPTASLENFGYLPYTNLSLSTFGVHSDVLGQHISMIQHTHNLKTCTPSKAFKIHNVCFPVAFALALL